MDDVVVGGKFKIGMKIGSGSYGVIHEGVNIESGEKVAIKLEPANTEYPLLEHESDIYKHLDGGPGIPKLKWFGVEGEHNIMVIDLLGQSLADLMSSGPLDMKTVLILAVQLILTLEYIHSRGVIHRDIKPDNLLMGLGSNAHQVYLVDFGLAGYYIDPSSDEHIEYRESNGFVGTYRYASMFSHYGIEQSRRDDLHSLGYVLLYLLGGSLPWQGLSAERDQEELHRLYYEKKSEILVQELCKSCPRGFKRYFLVCRNLSFYEEPAYRLFRRNFLDDFEDLGFKSDYIYYMPYALKNKNRNRIGAGNMEIDGVDSISRLLKNKMLYLVPDPPEYVPDPPENRNRIGAGNKETNRENCISCVKNKNIYYMPTALKNRNRIASPSPSPAPSAVAQQPPLQQSPVQAQPTPVQPAQQQVAAPPPSQKTVPVARNGFGTMGKKCVIRANHFLVNFGDKDPHQYDVTITPEVISKRKSREILQLLINLYKQSHLGNMLLAYDGKKSAFAAGPLPFESKEFVVKLTESNGREKEFKVNIKFAARKDLHHLRQFLAGRQHDNPQETIQALDVVLREAASTGREILGRSLFSTQFGSGVLGDGIEYWKGFYQSLRPTQMGLSLNIDMSARAFYEPKLVTDFVSDFLMKDLMRPLSDQERIKVKRILRGVRVEVRRPDYMRRYKVQALTVQPTNQLTFPVDETGATISVVQYFREKYNINLRYPHLPAIQAGSDSKPTYLPMEICTIVKGQRYAMKLNEKQVTNLLRATCQRPRDREESIVTTMKSNHYNENQLVNEDFGMNVLEQLTSIDARVLPPPPLKYHDSGANSVVYPSGGQWNMINLKMINGGTVNYWAIANFSRHREDAVGRFVHGLVSMCQNKGMVAPPGSSLQLLFVILPEAKGTYPRIKRVCETELGIVSQCCKPNHVMKMSPQYFENVALKINVKVGGRNTVLVAALANMLPYITVRPTIIFGADVTHPSPGEDSSPSIAAVVASMDWPQVTKYKALVSAQPHRQEIIEDLYSTTTDSKRGVVHTGLIRELLISFKKSTGHKPHRIIFYRDGVSEGQFSEVLMSEMDKIRKACVSLEENYLPPVTFIVVQKRHHTRFFPMKHGDKASTDRSGNILPGTVVDTKICHPTEFDFYLCSHAGIKGTSRPTHYHVLYDENKFTADGLQFLTYQLCYTYQRCTRSVSIVPPAYYAHLAAFRARYYMEGDLSDSASSHGGGGPRATRDRVADVRPVPVIHENVKSVMFYC